MIEDMSTNPLLLFTPTQQQEVLQKADAIRRIEAFRMYCREVRQYCSNQKRLLFTAIDAMRDLPELVDMTKTYNAVCELELLVRTKYGNMIDEFNNKHTPEVETWDDDAPSLADSDPPSAQ